MYINKLTLA